VQVKKYFFGILYLFLDFLNGICILCFSNPLFVKSLSEFIALPLEQQFDYLWNNCQRIASREEGKILISLYYGQGLLVEVWFSQYGDLIRISPYTNYRSLYKEGMDFMPIAGGFSSEKYVGSH
jgi:hypothetical protein